MQGKMQKWFLMESQVGNCSATSWGAWPALDAPEENNTFWMKKNLPTKENPKLRIPTHTIIVYIYLGKLKLYRGHYIPNPNNALLYGKSLKITIHLYLFFDPPKIGNLMIPAISECFGHFDGVFPYFSPPPFGVTNRRVARREICTEC